MSWVVYMNLNGYDLKNHRDIDYVLKRFQMLLDMLPELEQQDNQDGGQDDYND